MNIIPKADTDSYFSILKSQKGNDKCFDCGKNGPTWISLRHAVFICTSCAGKHRSLGFRIKSILLDNFIEDELKRINLGGNFHSDNSDIDIKYSELSSLPITLDSKMKNEIGPLKICKDTSINSDNLVVNQNRVKRFEKSIGILKSQTKENVITTELKLNSVAVVEKESKDIVIQREGLAINKSTYKMGGVDKSRIGFGAGKFRKPESD